MFTFSCIGKDGSEWIIHIPADDFKDAENVIEQLGLVVKPYSYGKLHAEIGWDEFAMSSIREQ